MKNLNWSGRMVFFVSAEKLIGAFLFGLLNFTIPFGSDWLYRIFAVAWAMLYIDLGYGRIVMYVLAGRLARRFTSHKAMFEALIFPITLLGSYCLINVLSVSAQNVLFTVHNGHLNLGVCQLLVSGVISIAYLLYSEFGVSGDEESSAN